VALDAGYDVIRLAWLLADLPLVLCARLRGNRVMYRPPPRPFYLPCGSETLSVSTTRS
jgi:hypothetical protein